jgi:hypothetical protein
MGTYENFYLNRIKQLQEENKQLRAVLNEARIRKGNLPEPDGRTSPTAMRNWERRFMTADALTALVDPHHDIHKKENRHIKDSIIRVLADMGSINLEGSNTDRIPSGGIPAAEGGPGTGTANREDMEKFIRATSPSSQSGFGYTSITDKPNR